MPLSKKDYPPLLLEVFEVINTSLINNRIDDTLAHEAAIEAAEALINNWKGSHIYIPGSKYLDSFKNSARDKEIMHQFNGKNYDELAIKFGLSHVWIRKIIKKMNRKTKGN